MSAATVTWADGFGNWHARADSEQAAWDAIAAEHLARDASTMEAMRERMTLRPVDPEFYGPNVWHEVWEGDPA